MVGSRISEKNATTKKTCRKLTITGLGTLLLLQTQLNNIWAICIILVCQIDTAQETAIVQ